MGEEVLGLLWQDWREPHSLRAPLASEQGPVAGVAGSEPEGLLSLRRSAPLPCYYRRQVCLCLWQKGRKSYQFSWCPSATAHGEEEEPRPVTWSPPPPRGGGGREGAGQEPAGQDKPRW